MGNQYVIYVWYSSSLPVSLDRWEKMRIPPRDDKLWRKLFGEHRAAISQSYIIVDNGKSVGLDSRGQSDRPPSGKPELGVIISPSFFFSVGTSGWITVTTSTKRRQIMGDPIIRIGR